MHFCLLLVLTIRIKPVKCSAILIKLINMAQTKKRSELYFLTKKWLYESYLLLTLEKYDLIPYQLKTASIFAFNSLTAANQKKSLVFMK